MSRAVLAQVVRFGLVGLAGTCLHLAVAWALHRGAGLAPYGANVGGFAVAFGASYLGHFYWSFGLRANHPRHAARFVCVALLGYALSNLSIWIVVDVLERSFEMALAAILAIVPGTTFLISRLWAFRA